MAIYIEESFFRPIFDLRPQAIDRALFIPTANAAGNQHDQLIFHRDVGLLRRKPDSSLARNDVNDNGTCYDGNSR